MDRLRRSGVEVIDFGAGEPDFSTPEPVKDAGHAALDAFECRDRARRLMHLLSGRAAYIHMGAIFGTIMVANVWSCILPTQRRMLAAAAAGEKFDASLGAQAKLRSKHNTFLAVPAVFLMLSNHFPVATYGNRFGWEIMLGLVVAGWIAAKLIREF